MDLFIFQLGFSVYQGVQFSGSFTICCFYLVLPCST